MILHIAIENLVVVRNATFEPGEGLTVVTGETGAGKTLLAIAIAVLFGADTDARHVGPHADHAWVEGEFAVGEDFWSDPSVAPLSELRPESGDSTLVLARRIGSGGRSRSLAWGRTVTRGDLAAAGRLLVATSSQHAHRRLLVPSWQRTMLDATGDDAHSTLVADMRDAWHDLERAQGHRDQVQAQAASVRERADEITRALAMIEAVCPDEQDERQLLAARAVVRNSAQLCETISAALAALDAGSDDSGMGAIDLAGVASAQVVSIGDIDPSLVGVGEDILAAQQSLVDAAATLRGRLEDVAGAPESIADIEDRLGAYDELKRRFGGTTESVMANWAQLGQESKLLADVDEAIATAEREYAAAAGRADAAALALHESRSALAGTLAGRVREELSGLGMASTVFAVTVEPVPMGVTGTDRVELRTAPASGMLPRPINEVASGGELSRIALALNVASGAGEAPTMIFDEIDSGVGGHTAHDIAERLGQLSGSSQVICISHLAQVAARADTHVVVHRDGDSTTVDVLDREDAVLDELCRMMGADMSDHAARDHARNLRGGRFRRTGSEHPEELTLL